MSCYRQPSSYNGSHSWNAGSAVKRKRGFTSISRDVWKGNNDDFKMEADVTSDLV